MINDEELTKVHVNLPNHRLVGGESFWARHLENDLYELRNIAFDAYDLNLGDVVSAVADTDGILQIRNVARRSGNTTLRVEFSNTESETRVIEFLESLQSLGVSFEGATERYFALDLAPHANIPRVREILDEWSEGGLARYETCEARISGSFDAAPEEQSGRNL